MPNVFNATDELFLALNVVDQVSISLSTLNAILPVNLPMTNAVSCASVVLISGYFESFLKDVTEEFIRGLNALRRPLNLIPYEMRVKHFHSGADALMWAAKEDKKSKNWSISESLARRLASLSDPLNYELAWESFANTKSNPGPDTVREILSGIQIKKSWEEINLLVTEHGQLQTFLATFIAIRNVCAHTGQHALPPTGPMIAEYTMKFRALAECIDLLMGLKLDEFRAIPT